MADDGDPLPPHEVEKLLRIAAQPGKPPTRPREELPHGGRMMGNPAGRMGRFESPTNPVVEPEIVMGNPKGSIGGVRNPVVRFGLVLALVGAIGLAVWRFVL